MGQTAMNKRPHSVNRHIFDVYDTGRRHLRAVPLTLRIVVLLIAATFSVAALADGRQQIADAVGAALYDAWAGVGGRVEIEVPPLDPRLQLPVCAVPLQARPANSQGNGGRVTVRVECQDQSPWTRNIVGYVRIYQPIVVADRALPRGTLLGSADVSMRETDISTVRGQTLGSAAEVYGMALRRAVSPGTVLSLDMVTAPLLVRRGDTVVLTAQRGSVAIRQQGVALQDGEAGRQIPVRNQSSNRVVQAVVTAAGEAEVLF